MSGRATLDWVNVSNDLRFLRVNRLNDPVFNFLVIFLSRPLFSPNMPSNAAFMDLREVDAFRLISLGRSFKIASSSSDSLVEVMSARDNSGLLVSGVVVDGNTRCQIFSGMSSRGVTGKVLALEAVDALADSIGRWIGNILFVSMDLKGEAEAIRLVRRALPLPFSALVHCDLERSVRIDPSEGRKFEL